MKFSRLSRVAALLPALLIACGGDDAPKNTGVFVDSTVTGLHYKTKGVSGLTNAAGEFKYDDGQQVTFSVGGIVIGSVVGAARVTPFDLFGVTPPTTATAIKLEVGSSSRVTDFERVLNVALFLVALDADKDPENGIDLADADAVLKDATLSFDEEPSRFQAEHLAPLLAERGMGNVYAYGPDAGAHLYASLGLTVTGYAIASSSSDEGADGTKEQVTTSAYNARGQRTSRTVANLAGIITQRITTTYDERGGTLTNTVDSDSAGGGLFHNQQVVTNVFDENHVIASSTRDVKTDGVLVSHALTTYTHDAFGSTTLERTDSDDDASGSPDSSSITTSEYDAGNRLTKTTVQNFDDLGVTLRTVNTTTSVYDDAGNELVHTTDRDDDADGTLEERIIITRTFDGSRHETSTLVDTEDGAHVGLDRELTQNTFDASGLLVQVVRERDADVDGLYDYIETTTRQFDANRKVTLEEADGINGGVVHNTTRTEYTYDTAGNLASRRIEVNQDALVHTELDRIETKTYTYDTFNNLLVEDGAIDSNADLTFDQLLKNTTTYAAIADGVRFLLVPAY